MGTRAAKARVRSRPPAAGSSRALSLTRSTLLSASDDLRPARERPALGRSRRVSVGIAGRRARAAASTTSRTTSTSASAASASLHHEPAERRARLVHARRVDEDDLPGRGLAAGSASARSRRRRCGCGWSAARGLTMASFSPTMRLSSVDLPTLGRPISPRCRRRVPAARAVPAVASDAASAPGRGVRCVVVRAMGGVFIARAAPGPRCAHGLSSPLAKKR